MKFIHFMGDISESGLLSCLLFDDRHEDKAFWSRVRQQLIAVDDCFNSIKEYNQNLVFIEKKITKKNISREGFAGILKHLNVPETVLPETLDSFSLFMYVSILSLLSVKNEKTYISGIKISPENKANIFGWLKKNKIILNETGSKLTELFAYIIGQLCLPFELNKEYSIIKVDDVQDLLKTNEINRIFSIKESPKHFWETDRIVVMETNIDDMTPEILSFSLDEILKKGALDFLVFPVTMKKGRSAVCVQVLCSEDKAEELAEFLFEWTSTFGIRMYRVDRWKLKREFVDIQTPYGNLKYKKGKIKENLYKLSPEFEELKKISLTNNTSPITLLNNIYKITNIE